MATLAEFTFPILQLRGVPPRLPALAWPGMPLVIRVCLSGRRVGTAHSVGGLGGLYRRPWPPPALD